MRRKKELTKKQIDQVEALASVLTVEQISEYLGISYVTFGRLRKDNPEIDRAYKKGKAHAIHKVAKGLLKDAEEGNVTAKMFYLKTQAGWRETNRTEITGANGKPIQTNVNDRTKVTINLADKSTEELLAFREALQVVKNATSNNTDTEEE